MPSCFVNAFCISQPQICGVNLCAEKSLGRMLVIAESLAQRFVHVADRHKRMRIDTRKRSSSASKPPCGKPRTAARRYLLPLICARRLQPGAAALQLVVNPADDLLLICADDEELHRRVEALDDGIHRFGRCEQRNQREQTCLHAERSAPQRSTTIRIDRKEHHRHGQNMLQCSWTIIAAMSVPPVVAPARTTMPSSDAHRSRRRKCAASIMFPARSIHPASRR